MYIDVGAPGAGSDAGVLAASSLGRVLNQPELCNMPSIPADERLKVEYHVIGDDVFGLTERMMKPFPNQTSNDAERIFNYRFSRARRVIECAFGLMVTRFPIFRGIIRQNQERATKTVKAAACLHNFLLEEMPPQETEYEDNNEDEHLKGHV